MVLSPRTVRIGSSPYPQSASSAIRPLGVAVAGGLRASGELSAWSAKRAQTPFALLLDESLDQLQTPPLLARDSLA